MAGEFSKAGARSGDDPNMTVPVAVLEQDIPSELPILPMRNIPVFPGVTAPVGIGRPASLRLIEEAMVGEHVIGLLGQRDPAEDTPSPETLYSVGTVARIVGAQRQAEGGIHLLLQGVRRFRIVDYLAERPSP